MNALRICNAAAGDAPLILALLRELADYEKLLDRFLLTEELINRDMLGPDPACRCELAFLGDEAVGILTWRWTYKTFRARRGLYLDDLFVRPAFRGRGLGRALLAHLAATTVAGEGCAMEWQVLDWNAPSIAFYDSLGAGPVPDWINYQLDGIALQKLANA